MSNYLLLIPQTFTLKPVRRVTPMPTIKASIVAKRKPSLARMTVEAYFCNSIHQKIVAKKITKVFFFIMSHTDCSSHLQLLTEMGKYLFVKVLSL